MNTTDKLKACARYAETSAADLFGLMHIFKTSKRDDVEIIFIPVTAETTAAICGDIVANHEGEPVMRTRVSHGAFVDIARKYNVPRVRLGDSSLFTKAKVQYPDYNNGELAEAIIASHYGVAWALDDAPYYAAPDIDVPGIGSIQVKLTNSPNGRISGGGCIKLNSIPD